MLFQPSNIYPSTFSGIGAGTVDVTQGINVSWQVNGDTPMTAYQIKIYQNDSGSTLMYDSGSVSVSPVFEPHDKNGNATYFTAIISAAALSTAGIVNGYQYGYKMLITQWWGVSDYVEQTSASVFITRSTPTLAINTITTPVASSSLTITANYSQAQGDPISTVEWVFALAGSESTPIRKTGAISTQVLSFDADGLITGNTYSIMCNVVTSTGMEASTGFVQFPVSYSSSSLGINYQLAQLKNSSAVYLSWDDLGSNILSYPYTDTTKTTNGITFTVNGEGDVVVTGTATADAYFTIAQGTLSQLGITAGQKFIVTSGYSGAKIVVTETNSSNVVVSTITGNDPLQYIATSTTNTLKFSIVIPSGSVLSSGQQLKPMIAIEDKIVALNDLSVTMQPIQDLHGYSSPWPAGGGVNLFDANSVLTGYISNDSGALSPDYDSVASDYIAVTGGQTYRISPALSSGNWGAWYDENKVFISGISGYSTAKTAPSNAKYLRFTVSKDGNNPNYATTTQVQTGSQSTSWTPYSNICPISGWTGVDAFVAPNASMWSKYKLYVDTGAASELIPVGKQITDTWKNTGGTEISFPWDVVHYTSGGDAFLKLHYAAPEALQFDAPEAIYYFDGTEAAGTYHIPIGSSYGTGWVVGHSIQFTLTAAPDEGDQLVIDCGTNYANDPAAGRSWKVYDAGGTTVKQSGTTSEGTGGTSLGTIGNVNAHRTNGRLCAISRVVYGYARWSQSAMRQYFNSANVNWWTMQNPWDRPPAQASTIRGFLCGFSQDFLDNLEETEVVTALNTQEGFAETTETTLDKIFLPSLEQMYINPQLAGVEGESWDYYKDLAAEAGLSGKFQQYQTYPILISYNASNTSLAVAVFLRSCNRGNAGNEWNVNYSGTVTNYNACDAARGCPACKFKKSAPDGVRYTTDWVATAGTVYGGTLDVVTGVLTVDGAIVDMGTMAWSGAGGGYFSTSINRVVKKGSATYGYDNAISSQYKSVSISTIARLPDFGLSIDTGGNVQLKDSRYATAAELKSGLDGVQLCYELATPLTYQLTATQVEALVGTNNVWSTGDSVSVTYTKDTGSQATLSGAIVTFSDSNAVLIPTPQYIPGITGISIYRYLQGESALQHVYDLATGATSILDYYSPSQMQVSYLIVAHSGIGDLFLQTTKFTPTFWFFSILLCDTDSNGEYHVSKEYIFKYGVETGAVSNNNDPTIQKNFTPYPNRQPISSLYKTGKLTSYIGKTNSQNQYSDSVSLQNAIYDISTSPLTKFLKTRKGDILMIDTAAAIQMKTEDATTQQALRATVDWVEVGDASNKSIVSIPTDSFWPISANL